MQPKHTFWLIAAAGTALLIVGGVISVARSLIGTGYPPIPPRAADAHVDALARDTFRSVTPRLAVTPGEVDVQQDSGPIGQRRDTDDRCRTWTVTGTVPAARHHALADRVERHWRSRGWRTVRLTDGAGDVDLVADVPGGYQLTFDDDDAQHRFTLTGCGHARHTADDVR